MTSEDPEAENGMPVSAAVEMAWSTMLMYSENKDSIFTEQGRKCPSTQHTYQNI